MLLLRGERWRRLVVATSAFLTLVDLFATQAIVPGLALRYGVGPAEMGLAVNACAFGMAAASLGVALFGSRIDRRLGILWSLVLLSVPTLLLSVAPDLTSFAVLRVAQGLCMASAFTLSLAYLAERSEGAETARAFAAYVTGNVASNLLGRLAAAWIAGGFGTEAAFAAFASLNLAGAALVWWTALPADPGAAARQPAGRLGSLLALLRDRTLLAACGLGASLLFAFIGVFTYVNFVLARPPLGLSMGSLGLVYLVFLPAMLTTPLAGRAVRAWGARGAARAGLGVALLALPCLVLPNLAFVLLGMTLLGMGTFFAQGVVTGFVGRAAPGDRAVASGLYLASYFAGGLLGAWLLGLLFEAYGWAACVLGTGVALALATWLAGWMREPTA